MMNFGYARCSTSEDRQDIQRQTRELKEAGAESMNVTGEQIREINSVQLEIFKEFVKVCDKLKLTYYMVHGSLLGAIKYNGFFPFDDDIDVAMPRCDYNRLIKEAPSLLPKHLFLQSHLTERQYPLSFAKLRNTNTAFIQSLVKNLGINCGIYIDIFPIDNYPNSSITKRYIEIADWFYKVRISERLRYEDKQPLWKILIRKCTVLLYPDWEKAVKARAELYDRIPNTGLVVLTGGKVSEKGIPNEWFSGGIKCRFEGMYINCPSMYPEYLACIYGDYDNYNPAEKYMNEDGTVVVSAEIIDCKNSYKDLEHVNQQGRVE